MIRPVRELPIDTVKRILHRIEKRKRKEESQRKKQD